MMHGARQIEFPFTPASARLRSITTHIWPQMRSLVAKFSQQIRSSLGKLARVLNKARSRQVRELIAPVGTVMGAAAFGWWSQSFAAALFAAIALFFLAGIYKRSEQVLAAVTRLGASPRFGNEDNRTLSRATPNRDALKQAIGRLEPWLANEVSLTEENAKEWCAVLLDSVAARARPANTIRG